MAQGATNMVPSRALALVRRIASPVWIRFGIAAVLEVPSRHTGTPVQVRLIPWDVDGTRYLMSQYGVTDWVRNLRAARRGELRHKGRTQEFVAIEVDGAERDRVIAVFHAKTPKPFRHDFEKRPAAADHPTFRVVPIR